jgi:hypothetical protein
LDSQVHVVLLASLALLEPQDKQEFQGQQDCKVLLVNADNQD